MLLAYTLLAAYLLVERWVRGEGSTATVVDRYVPLVPWLGPVYVLGMVPMALFPALFPLWLKPDEYRQYALAIALGAGTSYIIYALFPTVMQRPPLPEGAAGWALGLAYAARRPHNAFPSGHALYTTVNLAFLLPSLPRAARPSAWGAGIVVVASALFIHLHTVADIAGGVGLALVLLTVWKPRGCGVG